MTHVLLSPIHSNHLLLTSSRMQSCIKVANEAPSDVKSNLNRAWDNFSPETYELCSKPNEMKACLFSLCWFHAVVCGRRRFGQQGWSRKYSFNTGDLLICANVLKSYHTSMPTRLCHGMICVTSLGRSCTVATLQMPGESRL